MQQPDANGYVHIIWPSKKIAHGGIFHSRRAEVTEKQREFLKVLLQESKLAIEQRKKTGFRLREEDPPKPSRPEAYIPTIRPRTSKRRSLSAIRASGIYDIDEPLKRGEDREKLKERLINSMAYGESEAPPKPPPPVKLPKPEIKLPTNKDKWNDLITQIRERAEWLAEMEVLGQAGPHREIINEQIAQRLRQLDALGVDVSECSSVRSAHSTTRSREPELQIPPYIPKPSVRSNESVKSKAGAEKKVESVKSAQITTRSKEPELQVAAIPKASVRSNESAKTKASAEKKVESVKPDGSRRSTESQKKAAKGSGRKQTKSAEETVAAYEQLKLTPLQYSPRRRV